MTAAALLAALTLALPAAQEPAEEPAAPVVPPGCKRCDHRGVVDCKRHDEELRALEQDVLCSVAAACADCAGALVVDCERCDGGPESAAMEARRARLQAWAAKQHEVEDFLGREIAQVEGARIHLLGDVQSFGKGKKKVDGHLFLHLVVRDAELVADRVHEHYAVEEGDFRAPMRLWFWQDMDDHKKVMVDFLKSPGHGDFKMLGRRPLFSVCSTDPTFGGELITLHSLGVHNAAHMLLSNLAVEEWIGDLGGGWFDAGAGHWYEEQVFGLHRHYCVEETPIPPNYEDGLWRAALRKKLGKDKDAILPRLVRKQIAELDDEDHALSWSVYDWLVSTRPQAVRPLLIGLKKRQDVRELFREHVGLSIPEAEDAWRAWVQDTYPKKEKRPR